jgi:hypothetical protein
MRTLLALSVALILSSSSSASSLSVRKESNKFSRAMKNLSQLMISHAVTRRIEQIIVESAARVDELRDRTLANPDWPSAELRRKYDIEERRIKEEARREVQAVSDLELLDYRNKQGEP